MDALFDSQIARLTEAHFLILYWATQAEGRKARYNITNCFDDLKHCGITRTKQTAVAAVDTLAVLCFIEVRDEGARKNLYITHHGALALEALVLHHAYPQRSSAFLEGL